MKKIKTEMTGEEFWKKFIDAVETDDEPGRKKGNRILSMYKSGTPQQKEGMDELFITLCGYAVSTLKKDEEEETKDGNK